MSIILDLFALDESACEKAYERAVLGAELEFASHPAVRFQKSIGACNPHLEFAKKRRDEKIHQAEHRYQQLKKYAHV